MTENNDLLSIPQRSSLYRNSKRSYSTNLYKQINLIDLSIQNTISEIHTLCSTIQTYSKIQKTYMKDIISRFNELDEKVPIPELGHGISGITSELRNYMIEDIEKEIKCCNRCMGNGVELLNKMKEMVRKQHGILRNRMDGNLKRFESVDNKLRNVKKKQHMIAKEASDNFLKYYNLSRSKRKKPVDQNLLKTIHYQLSKSTADEKKISEEYGNIFKRNCGYYDNYIKDNKNVANDFENLDMNTYSQTKHVLKKFIKSEEEYLLKKLSKLNTLKTYVDKFIPENEVQYFIGQTYSNNAKLSSERHKYEPLIPVYLKNDNEFEKMVKNDETNQMIKKDSKFSLWMEKFLIKSLNPKQFSGKISKNKLLKNIDSVEKRRMLKIDDVVSNEHLEWFEKFLEDLFASKQIDVNLQQESFKLLDIFKGRLSFFKALHQKRAHSHIENKKDFQILESLIRMCFLKSYEENDVGICNNLLIMCESFYTIEENKNSKSDNDPEEIKKYLINFLDDFSIFNDLKFWINCYHDCLIDTGLVQRKTSFNKFKWIKENWIDINNKNADNELRQYVNRNFTIVHSFTQMMKGLSVEKQIINKFVENTSLSENEFLKLKIN